MVTTQDKIELLKRIAHEFNKKNITWALGASMLLYFKGVASEFHDIDLMVSNDDIDMAKDILSKMGQIQPPNPNPKYQTKVFLEYVVNGIDIDVMAGFSILKDGVLTDASLKKEQIVEEMSLGKEKIPLQSITLWRKYYELMGREKKVQMIDDFLRGNK